MNNIYLQKLDNRRYAEIFKPLYKEDKNIPLSIINCGTARVFREYTSSPYKHKGFVFMFATEGTGEITVDDRIYTLKKGDVICYRTSNTRVTVRAKSDFWTYRWIEITGSSSNFYYCKINEKTFPLPTVNQLSEEISMYHYNKICSNLSDASDTAILKSNSYLCELLSEFLVHITETDSYKESYSRNFSELFSYAEKNYFSDITVERMAEFFSLSKYHFIRIFKEYLGITPMKYIRNLRIAKASELLLRTDRTVEEIAEIVGYSTTAGFIENFKAVQGMTPLKYRKTNEQ